MAKTLAAPLAFAVILLLTCFGAAAQPNKYLLSSPGEAVDVTPLFFQESRTLVQAANDCLAKLPCILNYDEQKLQQTSLSDAFEVVGETKDEQAMLGECVRFSDEPVSEANGVNYRLSAYLLDGCTCCGKARFSLRNPLAPDEYEEAEISIPCKEQKVKLLLDSRHTEAEMVFVPQTGTKAVTEGVRAAEPLLFQGGATQCLEAVDSKDEQGNFKIKLSYNPLCQYCGKFGVPIYDPSVQRTFNYEVQIPCKADILLVSDGEYFAQGAPKLYPGIRDYIRYAAAKGYTARYVELRERKEAAKPSLFPFAQLPQGYTKAKIEKCYVGGAAETSAELKPTREKILASALAKIRSKTLPSYVIILGAPVSRCFLEGTGLERVINAFPTGDFHVQVSTKGDLFQTIASDDLYGLALNADIANYELSANPPVISVSRVGVQKTSPVEPKYEAPDISTALTRLTERSVFHKPASLVLDPQKAVALKEVGGKLVETKDAPKANDREVAERFIKNDLPYYFKGRKTCDNSTYCSYIPDACFNPVTSAAADELAAYQSCDEEKTLSFLKEADHLLVQSHGSNVAVFGPTIEIARASGEIDHKYRDLIVTSEFEFKKLALVNLQSCFALDFGEASGYFNYVANLPYLGSMVFYGVSVLGKTRKSSGTVLVKKPGLMGSFVRDYKNEKLGNGDRKSVDEARSLVYYGNPLLRYVG